MHQPLAETIRPRSEVGWSGFPRPDPPPSPPRAKILARLPRREREITELVDLLGEATAEQVRAGLCDPLTNSAIRSILCRLERKGVLAKRKEGKRHVFFPANADFATSKAALRRVIGDYFGGSVAGATSALIELIDELAQRR